MPRYSDSRTHTDTHSTLVDAVRADADLPEEEWERLHKLATPYQRRVARLIVDPGCAPHGDPGTYSNWGCRCDPCTEAATQARRGRQTRQDFAPGHESEPTIGDDASPLEKALLAKRMGFALTPKAQAILDEYEAGTDISDVI